jgi:hypothetical protein
LKNSDLINNISSNPAAHTRAAINKPDTKSGKGGEPIVIKRKPGSSKDIGGGESEIWNQRQMRLLVSALPGINTADKAVVGEVGSAVVSGVIDLKPKEP